MLDVRPGITDPASIKFRNENELMEKAEDPETKAVPGVCEQSFLLWRYRPYFQDVLGDSEGAVAWFQLKTLSNCPA